MDYLKIAISQFDEDNFADARNSCLLYFKTLNEVNEQIIYKISSTFIIASIKYYNLNISESNIIYQNFEKQIIREISHGAEKRRSSLSNLKIYSPLTILSWGKYEGKSVNEVLLKDTNYLLWCIMNLDHFCVESPFFLYFSLPINRELKNEMEQNLIKQLIFSNYIEDDAPRYEDDFDNSNFSSDFNFYEGYEGNIDSWREANW